MRRKTGFENFKIWMDRFTFRYFSLTSNRFVMCSESERLLNELLWEMRRYFTAQLVLHDMKIRIYYKNRGGQM